MLLFQQFGHFDDIYFRIIEIYTGTGSKGLKSNLLSLKGLLKSGKDTNDEQSLNISPILVTFSTFQLDISGKDFNEE